jgi:hypothetical protein
LSYDLFFRSRPGARPITPVSFREYFSARRHYAVRESQAWYANEDSGVYFSFELPGEREPLDLEEEDGEGYIPEDASFNLNYFRPHVFGLEAEPEVSAFMEAFDPLIEDPQVGGMGEGPYSPEGFLNGWNRGNAFSYSAVAASGSADTPPLSLPAAEIESIWRWNTQRTALQERLGESIFVPRVMFHSSEAEALSFVVWTDGMAALLPVVDTVLLVRVELAPRRFLRRKQDIAVLPWAAVERATSAYPVEAGVLPFKRLHYQARPKEIERWVSSLPAAEVLPQGIGIDHVLGRELLDSPPATAT